jgi:general stress protein 26
VAHGLLGLGAEVQGHPRTGREFRVEVHRTETVMNDPMTQLDERFSDPHATATPWPAARQVLESAELFWISTVRANGQPHVSPLVAVWHDGAVYFCTGPGEQKGKNLVANARVVLTTGCNRWDQGLDVVVEGEAQRVTGRASLERLAAEWVKKWDGRWQFKPTDDGFRHEGGGLALVFAVKPTKVLAFSKGVFSHTRYLPSESMATAGAALASM